MKFSVIVPIYNVEAYLTKCVDSILNQSFKDFELILVDDGSKDRCPQICDEYQKKDKRINVIHKKNGGLVSARNAGLKLAKGEYICYVDGDDWVSENLLKTVFDKAINEYNPDMIVFSAVRQFENKQIEIPKGPKEGIYNKVELQEKVYPYMMYDKNKEFCMGLVFPVAWNKIYKRELLIQHYCEEEKIKMGEDNAFVFECLYYSNTIYFCEDVLYFYNQLNVNSMTSVYDKNRFQNNKLLTQYIECRIGKKDEIIDKQINAFKAYWLIMAVFHEVKSNQPIFKAREHIKQGLSENKTIESISFDGLPFNARIFILLLKCKFYSITLILVKLVNKIRMAKKGLK